MPGPLPKDEFANAEGFQSMKEMLETMCSVNGEWAIWAVAHLLGVDKQTVCLWMTKYGIEKRPRGNYI